MQRLQVSATILCVALFMFLYGCGGSSLQSLVLASPNPLVALYSVAPPTPADVFIEFGKDTSYGFQTSENPAPGSGTPVTIEVAGMQQNTTYHMRAVVTYPDGTKFYDDDHIFKTGSLAAGLIPQFTTQVTSGASPQPGIELIDTVAGATRSTAFATDIDGNIIWAYPFPDFQPTSVLYPVRILPNGHLGCFIAPTSSGILKSATTPVAPGTLDVLREFDLVGNTIRQLTMADLNSRMTTAGFNVTLQLFSHDFQVLPNGHWLIIANTLKTFSNLVGYTTPVTVAGDVVVDLDSNFNPVWYWNEFDHFDVNRHPYQFPDWTHSNSISYSKDDGNFIISIRHQNWVVKVDYRDGLGTGNVLWKLGYQGDFKLLNGTDPTDWNYAQHNAVFVSPNTTGIFQLAMMDNGDDRQFPAGVVCGNAGAPPCLYSTVPVMQVNENEKTVTFLFHQIIPPSQYNAFAGDASVLANGNVAYDLAGVGADSYLYEVTNQAAPLTVWQMHTIGTNTYRGYRVPSLYPGVQW